MVVKIKVSHAYEQGLFRYGIISELLSRPPELGGLATRLREMSKKTYVKPWNNEPVTISVRTLERWYFAARKNLRPSEILQPKLRADRGESRSLTVKSQVNDSSIISVPRQHRIIYTSCLINQ